MREELLASEWDLLLYSAGSLSATAPPLSSPRRSLETAVCLPGPRSQPPFPPALGEKLSNALEDVNDGLNTFVGKFTKCCLA